MVINKKDFDLNVTVYEAMPDGKLFHLGYALQRASYAEDPTKRRLLSPGKPERVKFETSMVSRQMQAGSRLLVLVDANKNPMAQVNHGTGKDVSDESVADAGDPLKIAARARSASSRDVAGTRCASEPARLRRICTMSRSASTTSTRGRVESATLSSANMRVSERDSEFPDS